MAINFPTSPTTNDIYTESDRSWKFNGTSWDGLPIPSGSSIITYTPAGTGAVDTVVETKLRESVSFKDFGAVGDGVADDTTAIKKALDTGLMVDGGGLTYLCGKVQASGTVKVCNATFKRNPSLAAGTWFPTLGDFEAYDTHWDANKAAANNGISVTVKGTQTVLTRCSFNNAKSGTEVGIGLYFNVPNATTQRHSITDCFFIDNDHEGFRVIDASNISINGGAAYGNGEAGLSFNNGDVTFAQKVNDCTITGFSSFNNGDGVVMGNPSADNVTSTRYGHGDEEVNNIVITNMNCYNNDANGLVLSGRYISVSNSSFYDNSSVTTSGSGILVNGRDINITGSLVSNNIGFGIDVGGGKGVTISGCNITKNGTTLTGRAGVNLESAEVCTVMNNKFSDNNVTGSGQINVWRWGGDGNSSPFPAETSSVVISGNFIANPTGRIGVKVRNGVSAISIVDNTFSGSETNYIEANIKTAEIRNNHKETGTLPALAVTANVVEVPDYADQCRILTASSTVNELQYKSMIELDGKIAWADVTAAGSGYTSEPTLTFSGGGGSGATGRALIYDGAVNGIRVDSAGSGYTSAPTISITGGGGSGATATAQVGMPLPNFRRLNLEAGQSTTLTTAGTPIIQDPTFQDLTLTLHCAVGLFSRDNRWFVNSKNF